MAFMTFWAAAKTSSAKVILSQEGSKAYVQICVHAHIQTHACMPCIHAYIHAYMYLYVVCMHLYIYVCVLYCNALYHTIVYSYVHPVNDGGTVLWF